MTTTLRSVDAELDRIVAALREPPAEPAIVERPGYVLTANSDLRCERAAPRTFERAPLPIYPLPADLPPPPVARRAGAPA